ncbi:MAG: nickel pincer cofactor biosynthesis protein LarC [bacterium]
MKVLHLEPFAGISGDMFLGALVDLGVGIDLLQDQVAELGLADRVRLRTRRTRRCGITGTKVDVAVDGVVEGPSEERGAGHDSGRKGRSHGTHVSELLERIEESGLDPEVKEMSAAAFRRLAGAEARVHGTGADRVHLHEAGALDALVDVTCTCAAVSALEVERVVSAPPRDGHGEVEAVHGILPVPAPAAAYLLEGCPVERIDVPFEMITPTGAALLVGLTDEFTHEVSMLTRRVGYGAGTRELAGRPNLLRATLGEMEAGAPGGLDRVAVLETVVDDLNPELWPHVIDRLLESGARDAWLTTVVMKKGRPGVQLTVLCEPGRRMQTEQVVFRETGTLGMRVRTSDRTVLARTAGTLRTRLGAVRVKCSRLPGEGAWRVHPEYDACREAALREGVPLRDVYRAVEEAAGDGERLILEEPS